MTLLQVVVFLNHLHQADCDARWRYSSTNSLTATLDLTGVDDDLTSCRCLAGQCNSVLLDYEFPAGPRWGAGPLLCTFTCWMIIISSSSVLLIIIITSLGVTFSSMYLKWWTCFKQQWAESERLYSCYFLSVYLKYSSVDSARLHLVTWRTSRTNTEC